MEILATLTTAKKPFCRYWSLNETIKNHYQYFLSSFPYLLAKEFLEKSNNII